MFQFKILDLKEDGRGYFGIIRKETLDGCQYTRIILAVPGTDQSEQDSLKQAQIYFDHYK